jgi:hypothetical protein
MPPPAKGTRQPVASKPLLDCFWNLADVEPTARVEAASQLLALLAADPAAEGGSADAELSPELAYALGRLIKGLASSRDCARQGFALALAQVRHSASQCRALGARRQLLVRLVQDARGRDRREGTHPNPNPNPNP